MLKSLSRPLQQCGTRNTISHWKFQSCSSQDKNLARSPLVIILGQSYFYQNHCLEKTYSVMHHKTHFLTENLKSPSPRLPRLKTFQPEEVLFELFKHIFLRFPKFQGICEIHRREEKEFLMHHTHQYFYFCVIFDATLQMMKSFLNYLKIQFGHISYLLIIRFNNYFYALQNNC